MLPMKSANLDREIRSRVDALVAEISEVVKVAALDAVRNALGDGIAPARGTGRPRKSGIPSPVTMTAPKARKGRGGKRSSEDVLLVADQFHAYVKSNEGQRLEQIAAGLGVPSKTLKLPVLKLFEQKRIKTTGAKRGTKYFAK